MKSFLTAGVLLLAFCSIGHSYDKPPSNIEVERPPYPYSFGDYTVVIDERNEMELICTAEGTPEPTFRWEYNGGPLKDDERITDVDGVLTIREPTREDEGKYQCFATNKYGTALSSIYQALFAFQDNFEDVSIVKEEFTEGDEAILECGAPVGAPKPRIYWTDAIEIENIVTDDRVSYSTEGNLHFSNIQESDEGGYFCFAANAMLGNYMRSPMHSVRVNDGDGQPRPATVSSLPPNIEGLRTEKFKIKCLARGFPTPQITWFRNGNELPGDNGGISLENYNQDLVFAALDFQDAGNYECRATNEDNVASLEVHLTVNSAPYFRTEPEDLVLAPGESSSIFCHVGGVPAPTFIWLQNGAEIRDSVNSVYEVDGDTININEVRGGDSTVFQCIASNVHGVKVGSYTITVLAIPATISDGPLPRVTAPEGSSFTLDCVAFGSPTPTVEWQKDGDKLESGGRILITEENEGATSHLEVSALVLDDAGVYECHALNNVGNSTESSTITVRLPTSVTLTPETQNVMKGNRADFTCNVVADERAEPTITWFFKDAELDPNQRGSEYGLVGNNVLRVLSTKASHTGTFKCLAETEHDEDSATAELIVQAEPNVPYHVEVVVNGLEATLSWTEPADNNAEIQNYTIEHRTQHDTFPLPSDMAPWAKLRTIKASSTSDTIQLQNYIEYSFRVTASNIVGTSEKSDVVIAPMTPAAPPDEDSMPENIRSEAREPGKLTVSWDEVHPFNHKGPDFSYVVRWRKEGETEWREEVIEDPSQTSFDITGEEYENIEFSVGVRNAQNDGPEPEEEFGTTGQEDIDECNSDPTPCPPQSTCQNTYGSFICTCNPGYLRSVTQCTDINECVNGPQFCVNSTSDCVNTVGDYHCVCKVGYAGSLYYPSRGMESTCQEMSSPPVYLIVLIIIPVLVIAVIVIALILRKTKDKKITGTEDGEHQDFFNAGAIADDPQEYEEIHDTPQDSVPTLAYYEERIFPEPQKQPVTPPENSANSPSLYSFKLYKLK